MLGPIAESKELVVAHEAGHAVIAHTEGESFDRIRIFREKGPHAPNWDRWHGGVGSFRREMSSQTLTRIAIAGPLAEAKSICCLSTNSAVFNAGSWERSLFSRLPDWRALPFDDQWPIDGAIPFEVDGNSVLQVPLSFFEDDLRQLGGSIEEVIDHAILVQSRLNDSEIWSAICSVRERILETAATVSIDESGTRAELVELKHNDFISLVKRFL